ncbi:MAG: protein-L-isoaspartate(D-aspartate) O-methyltransferase [Ignavibacteriales bacterium]
MDNTDFSYIFKNKAVYDVLSTLDRSSFIDTDEKKYSNYDAALSIGYGQTISQPSLVALMIDLLDVKANHTVLEIGTGSGYQTAFLAQLAGRVYTIEVIKELSNIAEGKLRRIGYANIFFKVGDGSEGWPEKAPYDRIIVSAAAGEIPPALIEQLSLGGKMIIPVGEKGGQDLILVSKDINGVVVKKSVEKVRFVEFVGKYGWKS